MLKTKIILNIIKCGKLHKFELNDDCHCHCHVRQSISWSWAGEQGRHASGTSTCSLRIKVEIMPNGSFFGLTWSHVSGYSSAHNGPNQVKFGVIM